MSNKKSTNVEHEVFLRNLYEACGTDKTKKIADMVGVIYQTIDNYVRGRIPRADVLKKISDSTNVSIHWLLTNEGPKNRDVLKTMGDVDLEKERREAIKHYLLDKAQELKQREEIETKKSKSV